MRSRRIGPSFLLRAVTLLSTAAIATLSVLLLHGRAMLIGIGVSLVLWAVEESFGVIAHWIARRARRNSSITGPAVDSIWFVDRDADAQRARERHITDTGDNPTIR